MFVYFLQVSLKRLFCIALRLCNFARDLFPKLKSSAFHLLPLENQ